ncbi:MAG: hypothetical protein ACI8PZ_000163 [Myxococcota bacterium]
MLHPALGPLVRVEIRGASGPSLTGLAVIDTGASMSAIDKTAAATLALPTFGAASWYAVTGGDRPIAPLRRAQIRLGDVPVFWELDLIEVPDLNEAVAGYRALILLGWDFLQDCVVGLDGPSGTWTLQLPPVPQAQRRRR